MATKMDEPQEEVRVEKVTEDQSPKIDKTEMIFRVYLHGRKYEVIFRSGPGDAEVEWNDAFSSVWEVTGFINNRWPENATQTLPDGRTVQFPFKQALVNLIETKAAKEQQEPKLIRTDKPPHPADDMKTEDSDE